MEEPTVFQFVASLEGQINDEDASLTGGGTIQRGAGTTIGSYTMAEIPTKFDPRLYSTVLITGYPHASKAIGGAQNIFAGRTYEYERIVAFQDDSRFVFKARCERKDDTIESTFQIDGSAPGLELVLFEPLVEKWIPMGPGKVYGHFTGSWLAADGSRIIGEASTQYSIETDETLRSVQHRFITIDITTDGKEITKNQFVTLWKDFPDHRIWKGA